MSIDTSSELGAEGSTLTELNPGQLVAYGKAGENSWKFAQVPANGVLVISNASFDGDPLPAQPKRFTPLLFNSASGSDHHS